MSENIKLIVCDVDGTLLDKKSERLSVRTVDAINRLAEKGIVFAAASGRSFLDLKHIFSGVSENMYYICFDGALTVKNGTDIFSLPIEKSVLEKTDASGVNVVYYGKHRNSENYKDVGEVYKIAVKNDFSSARMRNYTESNRLLRKVYQGKELIEYASPEVDKSSAVKFLQDMLNISRNETAAFGDNYNDIGLLKCAAYSYAAAGAVPDIKRLARYKTEDVTEEIIKNWL